MYESFQLLAVDGGFTQTELFRGLSKPLKLEKSPKMC